LFRARVNVDRNRRCKGCGPWVLIGPAIGYTQTEWRPKGQRKERAEELLSVGLRAGFVLGRWQLY
jgi:hypothetical protein